MDIPYFQSKHWIFREHVVFFEREEYLGRYSMLLMVMLQKSKEGSEIFGFFRRG